ncbi:hypothetical protein AAG906_000441 [Vitis piasezkii]
MPKIHPFMASHKLNITFSLRLIRKKVRFCVDYTNLNDTYPNDSFSLPRIDQIINSTVGHGMLSFLDVFSGYHENGIDYSNPKECCSEFLPILPSSLSDRTHKPTTPSYPAQTGFIRTNVEMGHRVEVSGSGVGLILQSPTGELMEQAICLSFSASNNEVEYEVFLVELNLALVLATTKLEIRSDSQLIVGQIQ